MKKITFLGFLMLASCVGFAQEQISSCMQNFEVTYQKVKDNYAGYHRSVTNSTKKKFDDLTSTTRTKAGLAETAEECYFIINDWLSFFEDEHLFININSPYQKAESQEDIAKRASKTESLNYGDEDAFKAYLESRNDLHAVEGIWYSEDRAYHLGIVKHPKKKNKFQAFLLSDKDELWVAGKVKFELTEDEDGRFSTEYLYGDFSPLSTFTRQIANYLIMEKIYKYEKQYPVEEVVSNNDIVNKLPMWRVEKIDDNTTYINLPPFTLINASDLVMEMVSQNRDKILSSDNLIIDLRDNPGGDVNAFVPLYPYISSGDPIVRKGGIFRATEENIYLLEHELESVMNFPKYRRLLEHKLKKVIASMKNNIGSEVEGPDKVFQYVSVVEKPSKVAILVNENTASSAEIVTLESKQSSKTVVIGTRTKGLADYIEVRDWGLPKYGWRLAFGLARSHWTDKKSIDNKGIAPDVKVPKREADWIQYAANYLNR